MPFLSTMSIEAPPGEVPKPLNGAVEKTHVAAADVAQRDGVVAQLADR